RAERAPTTGIERTFTGGESSVKSTVPPFRSKWTSSREGVSAIGGGDPRRPIYGARLRAVREERRHDLVRDVPPRRGGGRAGRPGPYRTRPARGTRPSTQGGTSHPRRGAAPARRRDVRVEDPRSPPRGTRPSLRPESPPCRSRGDLDGRPVPAWDRSSPRGGARPRGVLGPFHPCPGSRPSGGRPRPGPEPDRGAARQLGLSRFPRARPGRPCPGGAGRYRGHVPTRPRSRRPWTPRGEAPPRRTLPFRGRRAPRSPGRGQRVLARADPEPDRSPGPRARGPDGRASRRAGPPRSPAVQHRTGARCGTGVLRAPARPCPASRHGLLFLHPAVQSAPRAERGKLARALAG